MNDTTAKLVLAKYFIWFRMYARVFLTPRRIFWKHIFRRIASIDFPRLDSSSLFLLVDNGMIRLKEMNALKRLTGSQLLNCSEKWMSTPFSCVESKHVSGTNSVSSSCSLKDTVDQSLFVLIRIPLQSRHRSWINLPSCNLSSSHSCTCCRWRCTACVFDSIRIR